MPSAVILYWCVTVARMPSAAWALLSAAEPRVPVAAPAAPPSEVMIAGGITEQLQSRDPTASGHRHGHGCRCV